MKANIEMAKRLREMLTRDKVGVKEGFCAALNGDVNRLLGDYFELTEPCSVDIELGERGEYVLSVKATANRIKQFETTADTRVIKREA